jgi:hypothetical protein
MRDTRPFTKLSVSLVLLNIFSSSAFVLLAQTSRSTTTSQKPADRQVTRALPPADVLDFKVSTQDHVTLTLPSNQTSEVARIDPSRILLKSDRALLRSGADLSSLLTSRGIISDSNSLSIIYDLNPDIDKLGSIPPATVLVLPKVEGGPEFQAARDGGFLVRLTKDPTWSQTLSAHNLQMPKLHEEVMSIQVTRFDRVQDRNAIAKSIEETQASLGVILDDQYPTSQRVLRQSALEAEALNSIIQRTLQSTGKIRSADLEEAKKISEGLKARSEDIAEGGSGSGRVEVHTLKQSDGTPVPRLRVFYSPKLDPATVGIYRDPSSPTTEALPVGGEFTFWAGLGNDPTSVSDKISVSVKRKTNDPVKLLVK